ncbi:MAG: sigma 54-interacting transcriptional regulator, partial [Betaproteobacteria bacterium]|nr:sigma 54-interacting transcriptional regulator [Betaproteobacteria bacterium]
MSIPVEYVPGVEDRRLMALTRAAPLQYAFVSNSAEVGETIRQFIDPQTESLSVRLATMEAAVPIARELLAGGIEVVIGGGGTGNLLAQTIGQSVVKLDRDPLDVLEALLMARKLGREIALTSYAKKAEGVETYESLLDVRIRQIVFSSSFELSDGIEAAVREGTGVVVGGGVCRQIAASAGVPGIVVIPRESNVLQTLREARAIALARRKESRDLQELRTILDTSRDGLIVLDIDGRVKFINESAIGILRPLLSGDASTLTNAELPAALAPTGIVNTLESGVAQTDRVRRVGPIDIVVSSAPIRVNGATVGVVGTIREATQIQNIDRKVREKLYAKGFVARYSFSHIKGDAPGIRSVVDKARRFARSDAAIMIEGETGTGKELLAQSIHNASARSEKPFLAVNCSALTDTLLESELFGYEDGAFTGAKRGGKIGLFELAQGGSLFLDEVADISAALQMRLLRVIEEKEIMRIGGDRMVPVDVRIISSSQRRLPATDNARHFRPDLYYRLATLKLRIPPLRDRAADIPQIVLALFDKYGARAGEISRLAWEALQRHVWRGNMRELDSLVRTYIALAEDGEFSEALFLEVFDELVHSGEAHSEGAIGIGTLKEQVQR